MEMMDIIRSRHSVRQYLDKPVPQEIRRQLDECAAALNREGDLRIQILYDEPGCFSSRMAHYGKCEHADNYISLVGKRSEGLEERCGFYGEKLVLKAQELGLNTCWVALTHGKSKVVVGADEKEVIISSREYGKTQGVAHKGKSAADISNIAADSPVWFKNSVEAALLAPTAVNQQKFRFERNGNLVTAKAGILGTNLKVDLGIVKCHFELGAGKENFSWA